MSLKINTGGGFSTYSLQKNQQELSRSLNRLSTGKQINAASDDAAGMAIANKLSSQARGMGQAIRNANDAISISQVAEGALGQASDLVLNIREKAIQASSAAQTPATRNAIQAEIAQSLNVLKGIASQTRFNGQPLLSGTFTNQQFQIGPESGQTVDISIGSADPSQMTNEEGQSLSEIDVTTVEGAQSAIRAADNALAYISDQRSRIGANVGRLESAINNLSASKINTLASESQIRDLDYAEESINLNRMKLLARASAFARAQSGNVSRQIV
ncbi:MAG: flagellin, partial [Desulfobacterales bacterium]|nr:flagellin [Desulfobacterales bacterium]